MKLINDESGQAGGIIMFVLGVFITGFFYVAFGMIMNQLWSVNNDLVDDPSMAYTQERWNTMDLLFKSWWAVPIYAIILYIIWALKNALTKEANEI